MAIRVLGCSGSLEGGGSERQLWQLAQRLDRSKFEPQLYLLYRRGKYLDQLTSDVKVHDFWSSYDENAWRLPGAAHRLQVRHLVETLRAQEIDLVYDRTYHMTLVTAPACRQVGCPRVSVIVSPPSQDFARAGERFSQFKKRMLQRAYQDKNCRVLAVSEAVADDAAAFFQLERDSVLVVPSPIDGEALSLLGREAVQDSQTWNGSHHLCVVGRLSAEKGQRVALEAFSKWLNSDSSVAATLHLVGDGPQRAELEEFARTLGVEKSVCFHGFLKNPYPLIARSDLVLIPSDYEGLPNVALESMHLETAVIATDCSGSVRKLLDVEPTHCDWDARDCAEGMRGVIVAPQDSEAMALAIADRFRRQDEWATKIQRAKAHVDAHHQIAPWLATMEVLFTGLANE